MNSKHYTCTLEQAKRLKELGVEQFSDYYWCNGGLQFFIEASWFPDETIKFSAFTSSELGVMLPERFFTGRISSHPQHIYRCVHLETGLEFHGTSEAEVRAAMLIHLLENNLVTADDIIIRHF